MSKNSTIAIVGCGPAGLSCSLYLRRQGFNVVIYEAFAHPRPVGSGLMLQPTGMSVLHELGLLETVLPRGQMISRIIGRDAISGSSVLDVHYPQLGDNRFGLGIHRHDLFAVLFKAAQEAGVKFEFATSIERLETGSDGIWPVKKGGRKLAKFDFAIIANGTNSKISVDNRHRKTHADLAFGAWWATLDFGGDELHPHWLEQRYHGASKMLGVLPTGMGEAGLGAVEKAALFWSIKGDNLGEIKAQGLDKWKDQLLHFWPQTQALLSQISSFDDLTFASYSHYTLARPFGSRHCVIGDAYHAASPQLGQGANMALLDAMALGWVLGRAIEQGDINYSKVGETYYRTRKHQIAIYQTLSYLLTPFYQSDSRLLGFVRDNIVAHLVKIPPAPRLMAAMVSGLFAEPFKGKYAYGQEALKLIEPDWKALPVNGR